MQRVQDPTASATLVGPPALSGPTGYFQPAVPGVSSATRFRYWIATMWQEEMMNVLALGGVAADTTATVFTQIGTAIANMITAASGALGRFSVMTNVTGSRALGTTYTNSTGKPIYVSIIGSNASAPANLQLEVNSQSIGSEGSGAAGSLLTVSGIVPAGASYFTFSSLGGVTLSTWVEIS